MKQKYPIIILHGWATTMTGDRYSELKSILEKKGFAVFTPDLPGFGKQPLTKPGMDLDDYVDFVKEFMIKKQLKKVILIGHSFGGRIAAKLSAQNPQLVQALILTGSPLIRKKLSLKKQVISSIAKSGKQVVDILPKEVSDLFKKGTYQLLGEWDYYKAGGLKETFKKVIHEDLLSLLPTIHTKTLVVWGGQDTFVPLIIGKEIAEYIPGATYVVVPEATHKLPYEYPQKFAEEVLKFIQ